MKKQVNVMNFKKFLSYFSLKESYFKDSKLNSILDKMNKGVSITSREQNFLDNYDNIIDDEFKDVKMLTANSTFNQIITLLERNKKIICNISDRNGTIGLPIKKIEKNYENEKIIIEVSGGEKLELKDNFFYEINYNFDKDNYSLETSDEFFEKIPVKND
jgi:hypothetical protein